MAITRCTRFCPVEHLRLQRLVILALFNILWPLVVVVAAMMQLEVAARADYLQRPPIRRHKLRIRLRSALVELVVPVPVALLEQILLLPQ